MAGTISLSLTQQFDIYGKPLAGGSLYLIQAGTVSTPQNGYQDSALSIPLPNPIPLDAAGRIPQFFLADGSIKIRLQDKSGVTQLAADSLLVIGPSAGGGGGSTVDPTQLIQTGNMIFRYGVGALAGYVRLNNLTIGSATSGATERANPDCQALFQYLWGADANLAVSGGRGASAVADWTANKQLTLPDWRGYALAGLDDMGNTAAGRLTASYFGVAATVLGAAGGSEHQALSQTHLPPHTHGGTTGDDTPIHTHGYTIPTSSGAQKPSGTGTAPLDGTTTTQTTGPNVPHKHPFTTGDGTPALNSTSFSTASPAKLCTFYLKL